MAYKKSVLEAFQRNDYISLNDTITTGLTNIIQLILLIVWKSIYVYYFYVATMLVLTIINNILNARIVGKKFPQLKCEGKVTSKDKREIKKQVSGLMVSKLCFMTRNSFDSIFVSAFISLTMTTIYNNYYYIVNAIVGVMNVITSAMIGGIGNSIAAESKKKNYNDFTVFNFIYMWISSWATVTLFCLYQNFMVLWVGEKLTLPLLAPVLFSIYFYALKMCDIRTTYTSAAGLWWENRSRAICETIANIVLNYLLVRIWGVYGIVLATIIPLILINFGFGAQVLFKHYFTDEKISKYFIDNLGYAVVTIISVIVTFKVTTFIGEYTVANLFMEYILIGDYYLPALKVPRTRPVGRWGMLHKAYLKLRKPAYYQSLLLNGKLDAVLADVEEQAAERYEVLIEQMSQRESISEKLKEENQMEWVSRMRNLENRAEEIVKAELIYTFERR